MIPWMTRMSPFDTAEDLATDHLVVTAEMSHRLFRAMVYQETDLSVDWDRHPVMAGWLGYEVALALYVGATVAEATRRGVGMTRLVLRAADAVRQLRVGDADVVFTPPPWWEDTDVLRSHRSNLMRTRPGDYGDAWKGITPDLPYLWPFVDDDGGYELKLSKHDKQLIADGERSLPKSMKAKVTNA
jgi:hypothetical protein